MTESRNTLGEAVRFLAGRCDYASKRDNVGFNAYDAGFGHSLAERDEASWSPKQRAAAYKMVRKYRRQLAAVDIDFDLIPEPEAAPAEAAARTVDVEGETFVVTFPYDPELVRTVAAIPGRRWDGTGKRNLIPATPESVGHIREVCRGHGFVATDAAKALALRVGAKPPPPPRRVELDGGRFALHFPKDETVLALVRAIDGRRWDGDNTRWTAPADEETVGALRELIDGHGFVLSPEAADRVEAIKAKAAGREAEAVVLREASRAMAGTRDIELPEGLKLRPFQVAGVEYALRAKRCFIADDMGTGKTWQSLIAVREADAFPCVVVVRASIKSKWRDEVKRLLPDRKVVVLKGTRAHPADIEGADVIIVNYDIVHHWAGRAAKDYVKRGDRHRETHEPGLLAKLPPGSLIVDESHYGKTPDALRTRGLLMLALSVPEDGLVLNLSGTPILNRPIELAAQLAILGRLRDFGGYWKYARRYCGAYRTDFGMDVSGAQNLDELHDKLRASCYIRRTKAQVLPELPTVQVARLPLEIDNEAEYRKAERDVVSWVGDQVERDEAFLAEIADLSPDEQRAALAARRRTAEARARQAEELVKLNALRRVAARGKLDAIIDWVEDFLESGEKLVIFAHHRDIQNILRDAFDALRIHADDDETVRHEHATRFQTDPEAKVIVCSMEAAREGIDLFAASNVLFVEYAWNAAIHDQAEARCHRIGQEADSVTAWYTIAEGTIDEDMAALVEAKRAVMSGVTDGETVKREINIMREVMERLKLRAGIAEAAAA